MTRLSPEDIAAEFAPFDGSNPYDVIYLRGLIATAIRRDRSQGKHKVDRSGRVMDGARILGHVDRYDPSKPNRVGTTWRAVKEGGGTSPHRYETREAAAEWVATP